MTEIVEGISNDLSQRLNDLDELIKISQAKRSLEQELDDLRIQVEDGCKSVSSIQEEVPAQILKMLSTLHEMKLGSEPDASADYWEHRDQIDRHTSELNEIKDRLEQLAKDITAKKSEFEALDNDQRHNSNDVQAIGEDLKIIR